MAGVTKLIWGEGLDGVAYDNFVSFEKVKLKDTFAFCNMHHEIFSMSTFYTILQKLTLLISHEENYFILDAEKKRVGTISFKRLSSTEIKVMNFGILPNYRCKGLGHQAISRVVQYCNKNGLWCILICNNDNIKALNLYKKIGFKNEQLEVSK